MSALTVKGKIVGKVQKTIKPKNGNDPFDVATYFIINGSGGRPLELNSYNTTRKSGENIDCPVYVRAWRSEKGYGAQIVEETQK